MGITKQLMMEQAEQEGWLEFLKALAEQGSLDSEGDAARLVQEAIDQEDPAVVLDEVPEELQSYLECARCCNPIPPSELVAALDNGGNCSYCDHMMNKDN